MKKVMFTRTYYLFLDIDICRREDGSLSHNMSRKVIHTNPYSVQSHHYRQRHRCRCRHHHSANKCSLLSFLTHRAKAICDQEGLKAELSTHQTTSWNIRIPLKTSPVCSKFISAEDQATAEPLYSSSLPFNQISWVLSKCSHSVVGLPPRKISSIPYSTKDDLGVKSSSMYTISCECGKVCIGQTGTSKKTRVK